MTLILTGTLSIIKPDIDPFAGGVAFAVAVYQDKPYRRDGGAQDRRAAHGDRFDTFADLLDAHVINSSDG